jgi:ATP-binding cassette subfamily B protein
MGRIHERRRRGAAAGDGQGPSASAGWVRRLAGYCWRYRRNTLIALGASLLTALVASLIPLVQRRIIDKVIVTHTQSIWPLAIALTVAALVSFAGTAVRRYMGGRVSLDVQHDLRTELLGSLSRLDGARQDELHTGQVVSRSISDVNMVQGLLSMIPVTAGNLVLFVLSLVIMLFLSPLLTVVALLVGPALYFVALASRRAGRPSRSRAPSPGWWRPRSPACGWSRASARRSRSSAGWSGPAGGCSPPGCGPCG